MNLEETKDAQGGPVVIECDVIDIVREGFQFPVSFKEFEFITRSTPVLRTMSKKKTNAPLNLALTHACHQECPF